MLEKTAKVWLDESSFTYQTPFSAHEIPTDASAYRPDPRDVLAPGRTYNATITFQEQVDALGDITFVIRRITVNDVVFAKIR